MSFAIDSQIMTALCPANINMAGEMKLQGFAIHRCITLTTMSEAKDCGPEQIQHSLQLLSELSHI